jgi:transcriptional regulator with XRE-family HTH domain
VHPVKAARLDAKRTLQSVADEAGCAVGTVWYWENGVTVPTVSNAVRICDALNLSVAEILADYGVKRGEGVKV